MKDILEILDESIIVVNSEMKVCYCNHHFVVQIGTSRKEILGRSINDFLKVLKGEEGDTEKSDGLLYRKKDAVFVEIHTFIKEWDSQEVTIYVLKEITQKIKINLYEELLNQINFSIWIKEPEGKYYFMNTAMVKEMKGEKSKHPIVRTPAFNNYAECYVNNTKKKDESASLELDQNKKIFVEQVIPFRGMETQGFSMGIKNDMTLLYQIGIEIDNAQRKCLEEIGNYITDETLINEWNKYSNTQILQECAKKQLQIDTVIVGMFTLNKKKCLLSYAVKDEPFRREITEVDSLVGKRLNALEKLRWSEEDNKQFQEDIIEVVSQSMPEGITNYEIYPIKFMDIIIGTIILAFDKEESNALNNVQAIQLSCHQIASLMINRILAHNILEALRIEREIEEELKCLLEVSTDFIAVLDAKGNMMTVRTMNNKLKQVIEWTCKDVAHKAFTEFIHPDDITQIYEKNELKKIGRLTATARFRCKNGKYIWCEWDISYSEKSKTYICTAKDVSEQKKHEIEQEAYTQAKEIESIRNQFFANLSHEFRTPLNIILSSVKLLNQDTKKDDIKWCTEKIEHNALRLLKLSNNLIDLTKIDVGNERVDFKKENIISIIEEITLKAVPYAKKGEISVIFDTNKEEVIMACDREKIERMMLNLLSNAIKFTPRGGKIDVTISCKDKCIEIRVKDTGIGIPREKCKTIFEKFVQVDTSLRRRCEGSGMGLAIVKKMVEIHQGSIRLESEEGQGATFIVQLPVEVGLSKDVAKEDERPFKAAIDQVRVEFSDIYYT